MKKGNPTRIHSLDKFDYKIIDFDSHLREEIKMTELGRSLIEEGIEKGIIEGENKKTIEIVKNAIKNGMDNNIISNLTGLSNEEIEAIRKTLKYSN